MGQDAIARTLQHAIELGRTAHAYLFCGTRGVGKTSMARIFARALNAVPSLTEQEAIASAILRGEDMDVIEIDGASNRGVDDARDLIAGAGLVPTRSPYRIYIIDEVHMLTQPAFNALLKTMEEPPAHVKFILCTTEPHKVPATIQSRCQRFDFRNIATTAIASHLREVLQRESIAADESVVMQVARLANGSMRDGLSLLERLIAGAKGRIDPTIAAEILGLPSEECLAAAVSAIASGDAAGGLSAVASLLDNGMACDHVLEVLAARLRDAMVCRACRDSEGLIDLSAESTAQLRQSVASLSPEDLAHMVALCDASARNSRGSAIARTILDATVVRLCLHEIFASASSLLAGNALAPEQKKKPELSPTAISTRPLVPAPAHTPATRPAASGPPPGTPDLRAVMASHPLVREVMEVFDASFLKAVPNSGPASDSAAAQPSSPAAASSGADPIGGEAS